ncbi:hypothetical protein FSP39_009913 [Pinctada imbricata]|uniref:Timeless C-terminal domain-containing protein n=1 Tax=Pinctada imbricata TaxID=66713 RepID=A0AA89BUG0_PINIB|nr:hypothetical protein FSP39_009913 [Pinctada imbricata]
MLQYILINRKKIVLDDVYLLWLIAFFLKFARCQKVPLKTIRTVFSTKIFGFLVYEGVSNMEYLLIAQRKKQDLANTLRRIHMTVDALREMLQFLKICQENTELEEDDIIYLDRLKGDLTDMYDLRQFFLLLTRYFQLHIHSLKFLCDVVVTNHLFLLLMEMWMNGGLVRRNFNMLDHIRQFATVEVMKNYGVLVENVQYNNLMVNNCLFTMMHHVAGDCGKPEVLLQVHILKTFLDISEKDIIMTQEMEDLIEYVLQTFVLAAENNPLTCAMQLFGEDKQQATAEQSSSEQSVHEDGSKMMSDGESDTDKWTEEEEDILMMLYTEYQEDCDFAQKIRSKLEDFGIEKSVDEIVVYLTALGWIPSEHKEKISSEEDSKSKSTCEMDQSEKPLEDSDNKDLSSLKESEVIPYCIKQLNKDGFDSCVEWLKMQFCEVAYTKYVSMYNISTSQETEEPIAKHYVAQNKSVPLVLYNELQEHVIHNKHFVRLISNLGLHMPEDVGMIFPRIPHWWSIQHLVDSARQLGGIPIDLKFDLTALKQESDVQSEVTDVRMEDPVTCTTHTHLNSYKRLPNTMWMDVIQQINKTLVNEKVYGEDSKNGDNKNGCLEQIALQVNKADRTSAMECGE